MDGELQIKSSRTHTRTYSKLLLKDPYFITGAGGVC